MSELEHALKDLETATAALAENPLDTGRASAALNRRSRAIASLTTLTNGPLPLAARQETLHRLRLICGSGGDGRVEPMEPDLSRARSHWPSGSEENRLPGVKLTAISGQLSAGAGFADR
jgi:hypothetical protein